MAIGRKSNLTSPKFAEKKRKRFWGKVIISCLSLAAIIGSAVYISRLEIFLIQDIKVAGNAVIAADDIKAIAREQLSGYYLWFFPRSFVGLYSNRAIREAILEKWLRIDSAEVSLSGLSGLSTGDNELWIKVSERKPAYLWCGETFVPTLSTNEKCYFLDAHGLLFTESPSYSGNAYLKLYGQLASTTLPTPLGQTFLSYGFGDTLDAFARLIAFSDLLNSVHFGSTSLIVERVLVLPDNQFEAILSDGAKIFFNLKQDLIKVIGNLQSVLTTNQIKAGMLDYADIRFSNKLYYKLRGK